MIALRLETSTRMWRVVLEVEPKRAMSSIIRHGWMRLPGTVIAHTSLGRLFLTFQYERQLAAPEQDGGGG